MQALQRMHATQRLQARSINSAALQGSAISSVLSPAYVVFWTSARLQLTMEGWNGTKAQVLHSSKLGTSPWVRHLLLCSQHPVDN